MPRNCRLAAGANVGRIASSYSEDAVPHLPDHHVYQPSANDEYLLDHSPLGGRPHCVEPQGGSFEFLVGGVRRYTNPTTRLSVDLFTKPSEALRVNRL